jgi:hypothetical protein
LRVDGEKVRRFWGNSGQIIAVPAQQPWQLACGGYRSIPFFPTGSSHPWSVWAGALLPASSARLRFFLFFFSFGVRHVITQLLHANVPAYLMTHLERRVVVNKKLKKPRKSSLASANAYRSSHLYEGV